MRTPYAFERERAEAEAVCDCVENTRAKCEMPLLASDQENRAGATIFFFSAKKKEGKKESITLTVLHYNKYNLNKIYMIKT